MRLDSYGSFFFLCFRRCKNGLESQSLGFDQIHFLHSWQSISWFSIFLGTCFEPAPGPVPARGPFKGLALRGQGAFSDALLLARGWLTATFFWALTLPPPRPHLWNVPNDTHVVTMTLAKSPSLSLLLRQAWLTSLLLGKVHTAYRFKFVCCNLSKNNNGNNPATLSLPNECALAKASCHANMSKWSRFSQNDPQKL